MHSRSRKRIRLDSLLVTKGLVRSRERAKALILEGNVLVNGLKAVKAGEVYDPDAAIEITEQNPYVSRGGIKIEGALQHFRISVEGKTALDAGASTGGFTDCLLRSGARKVYAVDVGYGQLDWKLRNDPRVVVIERTNIRYLTRESVPSPVDIAAIDVSFISLLKVIPRIVRFVKSGGELIALIKPQFEAPKKYVQKGGVVKDEAKRRDVVQGVVEEIRNIPLEVKGLMVSPLAGPKGNIEYFVYLVKPVDLHE